MSTREFSYPWRGKVTHLHGIENVISFITEHEENMATPFYSVDIAKREFSEIELPSPAVALTHDSDYLIACADKSVYRLKGGKPESIYSAKEEIIDITASAEEIGILTENTVTVLNSQGKAVESLKIVQKAVSFAFSSDNQWLAIGTSSGEILAFSREEKGKFQLSGQDKIHSAAVTDCLFDQEELMLISSGADKKMMMTYLRGEFETHERSSKGHDDLVTSLFSGPEGNFYSAGRDAAVKLWAGGFNRRAASTAKVSEAVESSCWWTMGDLKVLATAHSSYLTVHVLDDKFKIKNATHNIHGIELWTNIESASVDTRIRSAAIKKLASFPDNFSVEKLANQALYDQDAKLRLESLESLTAIEHTEVDSQLTELFRSNDQQIHIGAFQNLLIRKKLSILGIVNKALDAGKKGLSLLAIEVLSSQAKSEDQSLNRLIEALNDKIPVVRLSALGNLEKINRKDPVQAIIYGTASKETDVRSKALKLGYTYKLLENSEFLRLIRRHLDDSALEVRLTAFVLSIMTRPVLADCLRGLDEDIQRRLHELDNKKAVKPKAADLKKLVESQRSPLVEAMATPSLDICLLGARCLSLIKDPRAFGVLLQLSRESDETTRIQVCKAFSALGEKNAIQRLRFMLHDSKVNVADAAFSALNVLQKDDPHAVIEAGLNAPEKKIRLRAVSVTARLLKKDSSCQTTVSFLEKTLHDSDESVRREAFKTVLNSAIFDNRADTLRYALKSSHTDIRREVLLELESKKKEDWSLEILSEMLDDSDYGIRHECFGLFRANHKDSCTVFTKALSSKHEDVRMQALDLLLGMKKKSSEIFDFIEQCLNDESARVREKALNGLIHNRCMEKLAVAVKNENADVSIGAARAQAEHGLESALAPLMDVLKQEEPENEKEQWKVSVKSALKGIASLAMPESFDEICKILESENSPFKPEAATAVRYVCRQDNLDKVYELFHKSPGTLQPLLGQALAVLEDDRASTALFKNYNSDTMTSALLLRHVNREYLYSFMDNPSAPFRSKALLLGLMTELAERPESPSVCLAGLSAARVDIRLNASRALDAYADRKTFLAFVTATFNERKFTEDWQTDSAIVNEIASVISYGDKTVSLIICEQLLERLDGEEEAFKSWWETVSSRFNKEINAAVKLAAKNKVSLKRETLLPLAIGTYVGILRLKDKIADPEERLLALKSLAAVSKSAPDQKDVVATCLKVALHDRLSLIRMESFATLTGLTSIEELSSEAITSGHRDIAAEAMKLLIKKGKVKDTKERLNEIQLTYTNGIEAEAYSVLAEMEGLLKCNVKALGARSSSLRSTALHSLFNQIEKESSAIKELYKALGSKFTDIEEGAAGLLAHQKDKKALPKLIEMLNSDNDKRANAGLKGLRTLAEAAGADAILDLVALKADHKLIKDMFDAVVRIGNSKTADRAVKLISAEEKLLEVSYRPMLYLTGYSQKLKLVDSEVKVDEREPRELNEKLFLSYVKGLLDCNAVSQLGKLLPMTAYCKSKDFDPILEALSGFQENTIRERAIEAQGRRIRDFGRSKTMLVNSLKHPDAKTKFLAAEGLALAGSDEGLQVLMTGMEMLPDLSSRERCVLALGQLANIRALDQLLRLATNTEHALQEAAIEAIGHMKETEQSAEIFEILKGCVDGEAFGLKLRALEGLRWFNSPESWHLIRREASEYEYDIQEKALMLLGFDTVSADETKNFLSKLLCSRCYYTGHVVKSLLKLCEKDPMEAYYAFLKSSEQYSIRNAAPEYIKTVCKEGDPVKLLNALNHVEDREVLEHLTQALLSREKLPVNEILKVLNGSTADTAGVILQLLHKVGTKADAKQLTALADTAWTAWEKAVEDRDYSIRSASERLINRLAWYSSQSGVVPEYYSEILSDNRDISLPIRRMILIYLENCKLSSAFKDILCRLSVHGDSELRSQAIRLLAVNFAKETKSLWSDMADSPDSIKQLDTKSLLADKVLLEKASELGVGMMNFKEGDIAALVKVIKDGVSEKAASTLIETISRLKSDKSEKALIEIIKDKKQTEEIQKAASRALKRSKRQRSRTASDDWSEVTA